jgi:hypothetical protein
MGTVDRVFRRRVATGWLEHARFDEALTIPGHPRRHAADLRLTPARVELIAPMGRARAHLDWSDYGPAFPPGLVDQGGDGWWIGQWSAGRSGPIGIGVGVDGDSLSATAAVRTAIRTWRNRLNRWLQDGSVVPIYAIGHVSGAVDADRQAIQALCALLVLRPELRPRLAERGPVEQLASDFRSIRHHTPGYRMGTRRSTVEITTAMHLLGYEHRFFGRPLPDDQLPNEAEAVERVRQRIASNPYARGVHVDDEAIRAVIDKDYLGVEPWPFRALTE